MSTTQMLLDTGSGFRIVEHVTPVGVVPGWEVVQADALDRVRSSAVAAWNAAQR